MDDLDAKVNAFQEYIREAATRIGLDALSPVVRTVHLQGKRSRTTARRSSELRNSILQESAISSSILPYAILLDNSEEESHVEHRDIALAIRPWIGKDVIANIAN